MYLRNFNTNKNLKNKDLFVNCYAFKGYDNLYFYDNTFWLNDKPCKKVYNSGTTQIRQGNKHIAGINKLRKLAYKTKIEINECPF